MSRFARRLTVEELVQDEDLLAKVNSGRLVAYDDDGDRLVSLDTERQGTYQSRRNGGTYGMLYPSHWEIRLYDATPDTFVTVDWPDNSRRVFIAHSAREIVTIKDGQYIIQSGELPHLSEANWVALYHHLRGE